MGILHIHTPNEDDLDRIINEYYRNFSGIHEDKLEYDDTYNNFLEFTNDFFFDILTDADYLDSEQFIHKYGNLNGPDLIWLIITEYKRHHNDDEFVLEWVLNREYAILWTFLAWNYTDNMQTLLDYASTRFYLTTPLYRIIPQCSRINGELHYEMRVHM